MIKVRRLQNRDGDRTMSPHTYMKDIVTHYETIFLPCVHYFECKVTYCLIVHCCFTLNCIIQSDSGK